MRTNLSGPETSPERERWLQVVRNIPINPEIQALLAQPTWSVASLLPPALREAKSTSAKAGEAPKTEPLESEAEHDPEDDITTSKLHHLLRLSALPPPKSPREEQAMLRHLRQQVHFVKEIQKVDTRGVEPLVAIRDETAEARRERTFTRGSLAEYLALEQRKGRNGTVRRIRDTYQVTSFVNANVNVNTDLRKLRQPQQPDDSAVVGGMIEDPWEMLGEDGESRKIGRFFYVRKAPKEGEEGPEEGEEGNEEENEDEGTSGAAEAETETADAETKTDAAPPPGKKKGHGRRRGSVAAPAGDWLELGFRKIPHEFP